MELKQQLTELIDAFASAKASGNQTLIQYAAAVLTQFLSGIEVTRREPAAEQEDGDEG
jgi:hypothetical protein